MVWKFAYVNKMLNDLLYDDLMYDLTPSELLFVEDLDGKRSLDNLTRDMLTEEQFSNLKKIWEKRT